MIENGNLAIVFVLSEPYELYTQVLVQFLVFELRFSVELCSTAGVLSRSAQIVLKARICKSIQ